MFVSNDRWEELMNDPKFMAFVSAREVFNNIANMNPNDSWEYTIDVDLAKRHKVTYIERCDGFLFFGMLFSSEQEKLSFILIYS